MIQRFNFYDIYGYFLPGAVLLLLFWLPIGVAQHKWPTGDWTSALLGAVLAYVSGIFLQTFADRVLPSRVERTGSGNDAYDRYPSQKLLDPYDAKYPGMQLSETVKAGLGDLIEDKFGIKKTDVAVNRAASKSQDRARNDAFFLARHFLVVAKDAAYVEQFEGMYALTRGIAAAFMMAAIYYSGWAVRLLRPGVGASVAYTLVTFGLVMAILVTLFLVFTKQRNFRVELQGAAGLLLVAAGLGVGLGSRYTIKAEWAPLLVLCALAALLAGLRTYRFYREFTETFAITVWRDFFVAARKVQAPAGAAPKTEPATGEE